MKLRIKSKLLFAAAIGVAFSAVSAQAQLLVNVKETSTFSTPVGGGPNITSANNGLLDQPVVITTGVGSPTPFTLTYNPLFGASTVTLQTGTLNTGQFIFQSTGSDASVFTSVLDTLNFDFDGNGTTDLTQQYTVNLTPFTSNGFTGINYSIVPITGFGSVLINGTTYAYASVIANSVGSLFDGSSTMALLQFQFSQIVTPVPEPSTYAIAGVAMLGGIVTLRRRLKGAAILAS